MTAVDVDLAVLGEIASTLDTAAEGLDALAPSVPSGIDAGPMSAVISELLRSVVDSAANISVVQSAAADQVRMSRDYYQRADADGAADFDRITEVMQP